MRSEKYIDSSNLDKQALKWLESIRSKVAPRPQLKIRQGCAALLIIDMLRYFADPNGRCFLPASTAIVESIAKLAKIWRNLNMPIVYTRHCHRGQEDLGMLGKFFSDYIKDGEQDSEIIQALSPQKGDIVIKKTTYDAFFDTTLEKKLRDFNVDQVVVTGVLTHMCCETTARSAFCRGFEVYVPVDAVASSDEELHTGSLLSMADSVAILTRVKELSEWLETQE